MFSLLKYLNPYYFIKSEDTMICINSFGITDKRFNYVIERVPPDDDEELDVEDYLDPINR